MTENMTTFIIHIAHCQRSAYLFKWFKWLPSNACECEQSRKVYCNNTFLCSADSNIGL